MDKINYKGLGHKFGFGKYSLITHYKSGKCEIMSISKKVFDTLEKIGFPVEG